MTAYKNFIQDYARRCAIILGMGDLEVESGENALTREELDVTSLLCVASSSLMMPYERLTDSKHISRNALDAKLSIAMNELKEVLDKAFVSSPFCSKPTSSLKYGVLKSGKGNNGKSTNRPESTPDQWERELNYVDECLKVEDVRYVLRTGLAHGNAFLNEGERIETLYFLARLTNDNPAKCNDWQSGKDGHHCIAVSPNDLRVFIEEWLKQLRNLKIPDGCIYFAEPFDEQGTTSTNEKRTE